MVNRLAHATSVTRRPSGGKTVSALLVRQRQAAAPDRRSHSALGGAVWTAVCPFTRLG